MQRWSWPAVVLATAAGCGDDHCPKDGQGYFADRYCDESIIGATPGTGGSSDSGGAGGTSSGGSSGTGGSQNCCGPNCEVCDPGEMCYADDHCVPACAPGFTWCDGPINACKDLASDPNHCNGCGQKAKLEVCGDGVDNDCNSATCPGDTYPGN